MKNMQSSKWKEIQKINTLENIVPQTHTDINNYLCSFFYNENIKHYCHLFGCETFHSLCIKVFSEEIGPNEATTPKTNRLKSIKTLKF